MVFLNVEVALGLQQVVSWPFTITAVLNINRPKIQKKETVKVLKNAQL